MDRKALQSFLLAAVLVAGAVLVVFQAREARRAPGPMDEPADGPAETSIHLTMGNPSGATTDESNRDNFLMRKPQYALSYNDANGTPNWVSWCLKEGDFGPAKRAEQFQPDAELPRAFKHVTSQTYSGSGFDRGHMCPRSDRTKDQETADATFVMTNVIPQSPHVNQKAWNDLEDYCRGLVRHKNTLYIVSGPQGQGGAGTKGPAETIGKQKVVVPAKCWKVVMSLEGGSGTADDAGKVGPGTRLIAVVMPNDQTVGHGWAKYRTSVKEVESLTGYKFFHRVRADVIEPLKDRVDEEHIAPPRHARTEE